jgi:PilZ domain
MGKRSEPRKPVQLQVRIFGTDKQGRIFSQTASTVDLSRSGVRLSGVKAEIQLDEVIGLTFGSNKVHFRVKWIGQPGSPAEGQLGLLNLTPDRPLWDEQLPAGFIDNFRAGVREDRRRSPRLKCDIPVELKAEGESNMWGRASDISAGGCFIEMPIPLKSGATFDIALWLGETKLRLRGEVVSSSPGFGIGVRFVEVAPRDQEFLKKHIEALSRQLA